MCAMRTDAEYVLQPPLAVVTEPGFVARYCRRKRLNSLFDQSVITLKRSGSSPGAASALPENSAATGSIASPSTRVPNRQRGNG
jgi:hypothetical protein